MPALSQKSLAVLTVVTALLVPVAASAQTLSTSGTPNFGARSIAPGFTPDPIQIAVTSGGTLNVSNMSLGADCTGFASHEINDMVVDQHGHAFVSQFGHDHHGGEKLRRAPVLRVDPDGSVDQATDALRMANGMVITADGRTLVVAESVGRRLLGFDLAADGTLSNERVWADLPEMDYPDGICIDAQDSVWISGPASDRFVRVREGGEVLEVIDVTGRHAIACALGGNDGHTLFCCTSPTHGQPDASRAACGSKVETTRVDVPACR